MKFDPTDRMMDGVGPAYEKWPRPSYTTVLMALVLVCLGIEDGLMELDETCLTRTGLDPLTRPMLTTLILVCPSIERCKVHNRLIRLKVVSEWSIFNHKLVISY